jgi:uncharacterized protein (DUF1800 family)
MLSSGLAWAAPIARTDAMEESPLTEEEKAAHLLNRLTYGLRPGDIEKVQAVGLAEFIESQLNPERLEDAGLERRLRPLSSIHMSAEQLAKLFPRPGLVKRMVEKGLLDEAELPRRRFRRKAGDKAFQGESGNSIAPRERDDPSTEQRQRRRAGEGRFADRRRGNPIYRPVTRLDEPIHVPAERGRNAGRTIEGVNPQQFIVAQMQAAKLIRAVHGERQLEELMVDFWMNHFNVFARKGPIPVFLPSYESDVIRPHALGNFRDLLGATAKSPAMLFYLDNFQSMSPDSPLGKRRERGLNENYARELMELHTLGVDGGYTQQDVIEVAKVLTGWTFLGQRNNMARLAGRRGRGRGQMASPRRKGA